MKTTKTNSYLCLSKILYKAYKESFSILTYKDLANFFYLYCEVSSDITCKYVTFSIS